MLHLHRRAVVLATFVGVFFTAAPAFSQTTIFTVPGATDTRAFGISPSGEIAGFYTIGTEAHGFVLSGGQFTWIDYPGATFTNAAKINPQGDVVGLWFDADGRGRGYLFRNGRYSPIDYPDAARTLVYGINARGDIVGAYRGEDRVYHGFLLRKGEFTPIDFPGATGTQAQDINSEGDIVGSYKDASGSYHMFLLSHDVSSSIDYPGARSTGGFQIGLGINTLCEVVGQYQDASGATHRADQHTNLRVAQRGALPTQFPLSRMWVAASRTGRAAHREAIVKQMSRWLLVAGGVLALALPVDAQNAGGLPGPEHEFARVAYLNATPIVLPGDVVHYAFDVRVGPGPYDVVRIHRVVKETGKGKPVKKMEGVLLLPGAPQRFEPIFMQPASPSVPAEEGSIALFLASNGVDVWGMDYAWSSVPFDATDFTFMKGWGIAKEAEHIQAVLSIARWLRATSGQGAGPIHVLGFSAGGYLLYAVASDDTQRPGNLRNVKGLIPVDGAPFRAAPGSSSQTAACAVLPAIQANIDSGMYASDSRNSSRRGQAALDFPNEPSPLAGGATGPFPAFAAFTFTNYQAVPVNSMRGGTYGGTYTVDPVFVSLFYTDIDRAVNLSASTPPFMPYQFQYDTTASRCNSATYPVTFGEHLGQVDLPIFYVARGDAGLYTTTLTASSDVQTMMLNPTMSPTLYQHADLFLADDAAHVVWRPILEWIQAHR